MSKPTLIAMVGLPRSGKSTIVGRLSKKLGAPIIRRDAIRLALHGERWLAPMEPMIKVLDIYMIKSLFLAGHEIVICDETNYSLAARDHMRDDSWDTVWYPVPTDASTCIARAYATQQDDLVPVIVEMASRWEEFESGDEMLTDALADGTIVTQKFRPDNSRLQS